MAEISYEMIMAVTLTHDKLKKSKDYEKAGQLMFARLMDIEPDARTIFGLAFDEDPRTSSKVLDHSRLLLEMINMVRAPELPV